MQKNNDSAATEVVSFMIIMATVMLCVVLWMFIAMPIHAENKEITHNDEVELDMADLKYTLDTLMVSDMQGVRRSCIVALGPMGDKDKVSILPDLSGLQSYGSIVIEKGESLSTSSNVLKITYNSANMYATNVAYQYDGGKLTDIVHEKMLLKRVGMVGISDSNEYIAAVPSTFSTQTLGGNEFAVVIFRLERVEDLSNGSKACVFSVDLEGSFNG